MTQLTFNQNSTNRYLGIVAYGTNGTYTIVFDSSGIRVVDSVTGTIGLIPWQQS